MGWAVNVMDFERCFVWPTDSLRRRAARAHSACFVQERRCPVFREIAIDIPPTGRVPPKTSPSRQDHRTALVAAASAPSPTMESWLRGPAYNCSGPCPTRLHSICHCRGVEAADISAPTFGGRQNRTGHQSVGTQRAVRRMATHFVLNTGAKIPSVGLGTWQSDNGLVGDAVYAAVKVSPSLTFGPLVHGFSCSSCCHLDT